MLPKPYRKTECHCGCGNFPSAGRLYVSGHNLRNLTRTVSHRMKISQAQKIAWSTKRKRMPIGATRKDFHGYVLVKVDHGMNWRKEHILVMEKVIGRRLRIGEQVHHINGKKDDNQPDNLYLCSSISEHSSIENSCARIVKDMIATGEIVFNYKKGVYERSGK